MNGAVLRPAEGEHVAAPVAIGELRDPVAPGARPLEIEHGRTRADEEAARPGRRDRDLRLTLERRGACLVEATHALGDMRARDERRALERQPEHLEVGDAESPAELGGSLPELPSGRRVAARVGDVALVKGEPAVRRVGVERIEEPMCAPEPALSHGRAAAATEYDGCRDYGCVRVR